MVPYYIFQGHSPNTIAELYLKRLGSQERCMCVLVCLQLDKPSTAFGSNHKYPTVASDSLKLKTVDKRFFRESKQDLKWHFEILDHYALLGVNIVYALSLGYHMVTAVVNMALKQHRSSYNPS